MHQTVGSQIKLLSFTLLRHLEEACHQWQGWLLKAWDGGISKSRSFLWIPSSCGLQILTRWKVLVSPAAFSWLCFISSGHLLLGWRHSIWEAAWSPQTFRKCKMDFLRYETVWYVGEATPNFVVASPCLYLSSSVSLPHKKRQAGDSLPERCVPKKHL